MFNLENCVYFIFGRFVDDLLRKKGANKVVGAIFN